VAVVVLAACGAGPGGTTAARQPGGPPPDEVRPSAWVRVSRDRVEVFVALAAFAVLCVVVLSVASRLVEPDDYAYRASVVAITQGHFLTLRWMDLFGDWIATKNGMLDTLPTMIESGEIAHAQTRTELLAAITTILDAGRAAGDLRSDVTAEDVAASLIGIFTVAPPPEHEARPVAC
jgi:hypothetical protein